MQWVMHILDAQEAEAKTDVYSQMYHPRPQPLSAP